MKTMAKSEEEVLAAIPIYMPDEEVEKFILFQKHYDLFTMLLEKKIFEQKNCAITLNFDNKGDLSTIERSDFLFSRRHGDALGQG